MTPEPLTVESLLAHVLDTRATARACFAQVHGIRAWVEAQAEPTP